MSNPLHPANATTAKVPAATAATVAVADLGDAVLTVAEVAVELRCSKAHVHHLINGSVRNVSPLPVLCLGRRRLVRRSTLEAWKRSTEVVLVGAMLLGSSEPDAVGARKGV